MSLSSFLRRTPILHNTLQHGTLSILSPPATDLSVVGVDLEKAVVSLTVCDFGAVYEEAEEPAVFGEGFTHVMY